MESKLLLVCALACFFASQVEGIQLKENAQQSKNTLNSSGELELKPSDELFQSVVGVVTSIKEYGAQLCTGSIIHEKFVLTSARCLATSIKFYRLHSKNGAFDAYRNEFNDAPVFVYANTTNVERDVLESSMKNGPDTFTKRKAVKAYFVRKFFTDGVDDIAIIKLESPLNLNDGYHRKLNLPFDRETSNEGAQVELAKFTAQPEVNDCNLTKSHFQVVPYEKCQYGIIAKSFQQNGLCLLADRTNDEDDACSDGLGGPIVVGKTVIGIMTSYLGFTCNWQAEYPQITVNVKYYKDFINNVIGNKHLDNKTIAEFNYEA